MDSDSFTVIWLTVALAMTLASLGYMAWKREDDFDAFFGVIVVSLAWPVLLAVTAFVAPFYIFYHLVSWVRDTYDAIKYASKE